MDRRRNYQQDCGLAKALDLVGERWTLLMVRSLLLGPMRYAGLMRTLPGITTNLLAKRLKELEAAGLLERTQRSAGEAGHTWQLTDAGSALEPALQALSAWGSRHAGPPAATDRRNLEWLLVALRRRYLGGREMVAEFISEGVPYRFELSRERARITRAGSPDATLRIEGSPLLLASLFLDGIPEPVPDALQIRRGTLADLRALLIAFKRRD